MVFVLASLGAVVVFLRAGRDQWFFQDEWDFLVQRRLSDPVGLLHPHYEHWTTLPIVIYRVLWTMFGIRSYLPYQLVALAFHLGVATLLLIVMRRAGVSVWVASLTASAFALFGSGNENVVFGFQITFTGALGFGLVQLVLAGHDGPISRRDWVALAAGLAAIMCAGPGVVMVLVVGIATLIRRGWKAAAFQVVPLAAVYGIWLVLFGESSTFGGPPGPAGLWAFVWRGTSETIASIAQLPFAGWVFAAVGLAGVIVGGSTGGWRAFAARAAAPIALVPGAIVFLFVTAWGRAAFYGTDRATASRYLYTVGAMLLPILAVALSALADRWPKVSPVVVVLLLIGIPGNIAAADDRSPLVKGNEAFVLSLPQADNARQAPPDSTFGLLMTGLNLGWLLNGVDQGRVPAPSNPTPLTVARARLAIAFEQVNEPASDENCRRLDGPVRVELAVGDRIGLQEGVVAVSDAGQQPPIPAASFDAAIGGDTVVVRAPAPPTIWAPSRPGATTVVCGLP